MRYPRLFLAFVPLLAGCPTNTGGLGTTTEMPAESEGETTAVAGTTSASSMGDDTTVGGGTSGSSSGSDDAATAASTGPGESSSSASDTADPPPLGEPYGPCTAEGSCVGDDVVCFDAGDRQMCLPPCDGTNPSCPPPPPDNEALVECVEVQGIHCMLNCAGGAQCPSGTSCVDLGGGIFRCLWS